MYTASGAAKAVFIVHIQCIQPEVLRRLYIEAMDDLPYCIVQRVCNRQTFLCATAKMFRYNQI